jgi:hypothetical protein
MYSRFNETLHLLSGKPIDPDDTLSVCAMGPVAEDDQIDWMRVWVWQQDGEKRAWSTGLSGQHLGATTRVRRSGCRSSRDRRG